MEWFITNADGLFCAMESEGTEWTDSHFGAVGFEQYSAALRFAALLMATEKPPSTLAVVHMSKRGSRTWEAVADVTITNNKPTA